MRVIGHFFVVLVLTLLSQVGGLAWIVALFWRRRLVAFLITYAVLGLSAVWIAPMFGRVALSCLGDGPLQVQSPLYCALNRTYVSLELRDVLVETATAMDRQFPGTQTLVLDANFPFLDGFPLLPHLSHDDGEKVDLAFFYRDESGYLPGSTRSPIGYFAFEQGPSDCNPRWPTMRWDLAVLQPLWRTLEVDQARTAAILRILAQDARVERIFVEPHLVERLGLSHPAIRSQGCRAARHDDHIHLELRRSRPLP